MSEPFLSEIKIMSFDFPPKGWAFCNGQFLPINQNQALFALLGTTYGGNGQTTFALPNLQGRLPMHMGNGHTMGEAAGQSSHTLTMSEMPQHFHVLNAINSSTNGGPAATTNTYLGQSTPSDGYQSSPTGLVATSPNSISNTGGSQAHNNMMPYLTLNFCIALQGIFPSRN